MKFPKSFRKENLDYKIDKLLKEDNKGKTDYDPKAVQQLFMSINDYLGEVFDPKSDMAFIRWRMMAAMEKGFISELSYTEKDLQKFCRSIKITNQRNDMYLGIYVSYLANRIIPNKGKITLTFDNNQSGCMAGLGAFLRRYVHMTIEGDVWDCAGWNMKSGRLIIKGDASDCLGDSMENGTIEVFGDAGKNVGYFSEGGKIIVHGNIGSVYKHDDFNYAQIYHGDKLVWPEETNTRGIGW